MAERCSPSRAFQSPARLSIWFFSSASTPSLNVNKDSFSPYLKSLLSGQVVMTLSCIFSPCMLSQTRSVETLNSRSRLQQCTRKTFHLDSKSQHSFDSRPVTSLLLVSLCSSLPSILKLANLGSHWSILRCKHCTRISPRPRYLDILFAASLSHRSCRLLPAVC